MNLVGIDYGSKLAGTTVIMCLQKDEISFWQSAKKRDADAFILAQLKALGEAQIFVDAPLSLPLVYTDEDNYDDYFYRQADRALKGMSPMFLGGLTARAMRLKSILEKEGWQVREVYPAALARMLDLPLLNYKKEKIHIKAVQNQLAQLFPNWNIAQLDFQNWHQIDALLALISGWRFQKNQHECYGDEREGQILI